MEQRACGDSGIEISVYGLGCWVFGGEESDYWGRQEEKDAQAVVNEALDNGVTYFDTAEVYNNGRSEESLGRALEGRRDEAVIGSKVSPNRLEASALRRSCENSLRRLQTETIDIYMVHWFSVDAPVEEVFATLEALRSEGKIRSIGVSNFGVRQLTEALGAGVRIDVNQMHYSLACRGIEKEVLPLCRERNVAVVGYMPLFQGILADKFRAPEEVPGNRARTRHFHKDRSPGRHGQEGAEKELFEALDGIREVAQAEGVPMAQLALAWEIARPGVACALGGARDVSQLHENIKAASLQLSPETIAKLDEVTNPLLEKLGTNPDYWEAAENSRIK
jgi:myo-inositol catabolism protein IolS